MAKMSKKDLSDIIGRDKPGFSIVQSEPAPADADATAAEGAESADGGLDLEELRRRYLGDAPADTTQGGEAVAAADAQVVPPEADDADDEIVVVTPEGDPADPWAPGPGRKSVVVSGKERRVIAEQG